MDKELKQQTAMFDSFYKPCMLKAIVEIVHIKLMIWPFSITIFPKNYGIFDKKRKNG